MMSRLASPTRFGFLAGLLLIGALLALPNSSAATGEIFFEAPLALIARSEASFVWRDLNQDGRLDLVGSWNQGVMVYLRRSDGGFSAPEFYTLEAEDSRADPFNLRIVEDFNADGYPDIYSIFGRTHRVMQNDTTGHFAVATALDRTSPLEQSNRVRVSPRPVDVDNDGRRDIIASPFTDEMQAKQLLVLRSLGNCQFADVATGVSTNVFEATLTTQRGLMIYPGLFNNDHNFDFTAGRLVSKEVLPQTSTSVYSGNGGGTFSNLGSIGINCQESLAVGDLNNDGIADLACDNLVLLDREEFRAFLQIRYGTGTGGFTGMDIPCDHRIVSNICMADMNLDGWNDLIFRSHVEVNMPDLDTDFLNIFINDQEGGFSRNTIVVKPLSIKSIQIVDFDQDSVPDIMAHNEDGFLFYRNLTPPRVTTQNAVSWWPGHGSAADLNGQINGEEHGSVVYTEGIVGDAFEFTEFGGSIRVPNDDRLLGSPSFTVAAWVRARSYPTSATVPAVIYMRGSSRPSIVPLSLRLEANRRVWLRIEGFTDREGISAPLSLSRWTHVAGVFDARRMLLQLYFDGALVAEKGVTFHPARALDSTDRPANCIGNHPSFPLGALSWPFHGHLDEVQFFDRALSQSEVQSLGGFVPPAPPEPPSNLKVITESDVALSLSWEDRSFNEARFELERRDPGGAFFKRADIAANTVSYFDSGLLPFTTYTYRLRAVNNSGASAYCPEASGKTLAAPWAAPSNLEASSFNARNVGLFWDDNTPDEERFRIERSLDGAHFTLLKNLLPGSVETADTTALPNTRYWYRVRAEKGTQTTPWSNVASVTTPPDPPIAPTSLVVVPNPDRTVRLNWQDKSSTETRFRIDMSPANDSFREVAQVAANTTTWTSGALDPNRSYLFRVRAQNSGGFSAYTNTVRALTSPIPVKDLTITVPPAPTGETRLDLTWIDPNFEPAKTRLKREKAGVVEKEVVLNAGVRSHSDTGLTPSTTFKYLVIAFNTSAEAAAVSRSATTLNPPPPPDPPVPPDQLTCTIRSATSAALAWRDRSSDETGFEVERSTPGGAYARVNTLAANKNTWVDNSLTPATAYKYRVRSIRGADRSDYSAEAGGSTPPRPPAAPTSLTATAVGPGSVSLAWKDNSNNEASFRLERAVGAKGAFGEIRTLGVDIVTYSDEAIEPATTYRYRVRAENAGGPSAYSNTASVTIERRVRGSLQLSGNLAFGTTKTKKKKTLTLSFRNTSTSEKLSLEIGKLIVPFAVVSGGGQVILEPGGSRTVQVSFTPKRRRRFNATLTVTTSDPQNPTVQLPASGKGK